MCIRDRVDIVPVLGAGATTRAKRTEARIGAAEATAVAVAGGGSESTDAAAPLGLRFGGMVAHPPRRERDPAWCPRARVWTVDAWRRTIPAVAELVVVLFHHAGNSEARRAVRTARGPAGAGRRRGDGTEAGRGTP